MSLLFALPESGMPLEAYAGYLDLRKYGTVPHSGEALLLSQCSLQAAGPGWVTCIRGWAGARSACPLPSPRSPCMAALRPGLAWLPAMYQMPLYLATPRTKHEHPRWSPLQALAWALSASSCLPRAWTTSAMSSPSPAGPATPPIKCLLLVGGRRGGGGWGT